jgi:hypothetical protein
MRHFAVCIASLTVPVLVQQPPITLTFTSDLTDELVPLVQEARQIWAAEGAHIIQVIQEVSGLRFGESAITVLIHRAPSVSGAPIPSSPLKLSSRYPIRMSLIHELGHRLNTAQIRSLPKDWPSGNAGRDGHKLLYLYLYDVWVRLYGQAQADDWVDQEKQWAALGFTFIKEAWEWALQLGADGRAAKLRAIIAASRTQGG